MAYLGSGFSSSEPADSSPVRRGAWWIRDIKSRLQGFLTKLFDLDSGDFKDGVIRTASLQDMASLTPGTYNKVRVNSKGLVTAGENEADQQTAGIYRAAFYFDGTARYDTPTGVVSVTTGGSAPGIVSSGVVTYNHAGTTGGLNGSYTTLDGSTLVAFTFTIPDRVSRVKAYIVGAGGGGDNTTSDAGGAGGEHVEATIPVTAGTTINVAVGRSGASKVAGAPTPGGASGVDVGAIYVEAGGGVNALSGTPGTSVTGDDTDDVTILRSPGASGTSAVRGASGSYFQGFGAGGYGLGDGDPLGGSAPAAQEGIVILEWVA